MHLWTEYEGRTIAESYTLGKLLRSEGRNGFFATADKDGHPAVIRLTEAHFDEDEQLKRWRQVAQVHQDNLIEIEQVGKTNLEGVALTYALMEPDDANLGDVLKERPLTTAESLQVAKAVFGAIRALHASGLVHEHIEPANVLAVGETVKLRSDCVRECVADVEFNTPEGCAELRRRDIHDFGVLLLQCLTLEKEWTPALNGLADPFKRIIPKALDGSWTLEQIGAVLDPAASAPKPPVSAPRSTSTATPANTPAPAAASRPLVPPGVVQGTPASATTPRQPLASPNPSPSPEFSPSVLARRAAAAEPQRSFSMTTLAVCIAAAVVVILLAWHFLSAKPAQTAAAPPAPAPIARTVAPAPQPVAQPSPQPLADTSQPSALQPAPPSATVARGWYVIAYTYNHQGQAQARADRLSRRRSGLHAVVFSPGGHAPYLVSLGGPMTEDEATAVLHRARRSGLPRDTFIRRY